MDDAVSNPESAAPVSAQDVEGQLEGDGAAFHKEQSLYNLAWDELNYTIEQGGGKGRRVIISQASGDVTAGQLCCIMGPSGAGKSSLLNTLSGRVSSSSGSKHSVSGRIMLNGGVIDPVNHRALMLKLFALDVFEAELELVNSGVYKYFHFGIPSSPYVVKHVL